MDSQTPHQRILITGSGGQLGSELYRLFGASATAADLPDLDITDRDAVRATVDRHRPDLVINAAAYTLVDRAESEAERCHAVNVRGVDNLVAACQVSGAAIVQISTDYVFDGRQSTPYRETDRPNPLSVYGHTKLEAEHLVAQNPNHLIIRTAGLFGAGGPSASGNFVNTMLELTRQGGVMRVVDDQVSSFTYTVHLARAIKGLIESKSTGLFHLTNSGAASWYQVALEIFRTAGLEVQVDPIPMAEYRRAANRPRFSVLDIGKYAHTHNHFAMPPWQAAIAEYVSNRPD